MATSLSNTVVSKHVTVMTSNAASTIAISCITNATSHSMTVVETEDSITESMSTICVSAIPESVMPISMSSVISTIVMTNEIAVSYVTTVCITNIMMDIMAFVESTLADSMTNVMYLCTHLLVNGMSDVSIVGHYLWSVYERGWLME